MTIKKALKKYSPLDLMKKSFIYIYCLPLGLDRDGIERIWRKKYKKKIVKYINLDSKMEFQKGNVKPQEYIFTCWLQGYENAPRIVQKCIDSLQQYSGNAKLVIITEENIGNYITLPTYIIEKWKSGFIPNAQFSDILRVFLLCKYGGIWLDSTVMLFDEIPKEYLKEDLFFFQTSFLDNNDPGISNWFIYSKYSNNPLLLDLKASLLNFWKRNKRLSDYYIFHDFVSILAGSDKYRNYWRKIPYINNVAPHVLQKELFEKYSDSRLKQITSISSIQKLTYKKSNMVEANSNYRYILGDYKE